MDYVTPLKFIRWSCRPLANRARNNTCFWQRQFNRFIWFKIELYLAFQKTPFRPRFYHKLFYNLGMFLNRIHCERSAYWLVHHVPFNVRFLLS